MLVSKTDVLKRFLVFCGIILIEGSYSCLSYFFLIYKQNKCDKTNFKN